MSDNLSDAPRQVKPPLPNRLIDTHFQPNPCSRNLAERGVHAASPAKDLVRLGFSLSVSTLRRRERRAPPLLSRCFTCCLRQPVAWIGLQVGVSVSASPRDPFKGFVW